MGTIKDGKSSSFQLELGKPGKIKVNAPCRFEIKMSSGSIIEGLITPNNPLTITSQGDIEDINVYIDENSVRPLESV
ncbi:hypothetical protein [Photobacterium iliopiscarium]|uniref:hypothetical protein n=1 Tax=Photobacterium iliopiscarium TaxID=56192 RepID=UPI0005D44E93|nr:hypothetical protein [Photobacterium iliopiscarium]KJG14531.1 hypothetical protein UB38_02755 [Photobacterium iliopiscarium]PST99285.1 hypothetical protein C9I85_12130 [Photobacterium iliopiscarium]PSV84941.1 hypothetical protein C9J51_01280 [Photobacterium iliopiscarium]USN27408.1 hypothetical protein [synthetic construct]